MRVSGLVITHQLSDRATEWLAKTAAVVDELVAVVPERRASPDLYLRLETLGARIYRTDWDTFYPSAEESRAMMAACRGDWILKVDHDEELSAEWSNREWRRLLDTDVSHFWLPRRWILPSGNYLDLAPWWPDWQLRLFRNRPDEMAFPTELHESMLLSGPPGYLRTLAIHHHDLWLAPRAAREEKARLYEQLRPDKALGYFYFYEESGSPGAPIPPDNRLDLARERLEMPALAPEEIRRVHLRRGRIPTRLARRQPFWCEIEVKNGTGYELSNGMPHSFNLAYHWRHAATRQMAIFEGLRTGPLPPIAPGECRKLKMFVVAPDKPGTYTLQTTAVQEHFAWLEEQHPHIGHESTIEID